MENHPIPQDITGFQFKLIGNMTVKQFAYLAAGVILGWAFYSAPFSFLIRFPLALFFAGGGISLAFLPVEGRPLDIMAYHFAKALFTPDQYIYQKVGGDIGILMQIQAPKTQAHTQQATEDKLQVYLHNLPQKPKNKLDEKETMFFQSLSSYSNPVQAAPAVQVVVAAPPAEAVPPIHIPLSSPPPISDQPSSIEEKLREQAYLLQMRLNEAKKNEQKQATPTAHQEAEVLQQQLALIQQQKKQLEDQLLVMAQQLQKPSGPKTFVPSEAQPKEETQHVRKIPANMAASVGLPIKSEFPNLLLGIVKDPRGNVLPNILVEVRDADGNPVRAFKTNQLGQFASATALLNGTYTLVFEDNSGKQKFDSVEIEATGDIIQPLEIISMDAREELRKELFGN